MEWVEVRDEANAVIWKSPEVASVAFEKIESMLRILDIQTSQVVSGYQLGPGQRVVIVKDGDLPANAE